jgi:hypothetical protein
MCSIGCWTGTRGLRELGPTGALVNHLIDKASATPPF